MTKNYSSACHAAIILTFAQYCILKEAQLDDHLFFFCAFYTNLWEKCAIVENLVSVRPMSKFGKEKDVREKV